MFSKILNRNFVTVAALLLSLVWFGLTAIGIFPLNLPAVFFPLVWFVAASVGMDHFMHKSNALVRK